MAAVLRAYAPAAAAIRRGLCGLLPDRALRLCTWVDLQRLACGESDIDIGVLRRNTVYDSRGILHDNHPIIKWFWQIMESLAPEQKRNFVRFAWGCVRPRRGGERGGRRGPRDLCCTRACRPPTLRPSAFPLPPRSRSKLPRGVWPKNSKGEQVKFKIVPKAGYVGLPLAHTCFFLLECGTGYTSYEAMRRSFVTAILYGASEGFLIQ
jgi:hypothetical protein